MNCNMIALNSKAWDTPMVRYRYDPALLLLRFHDRTALVQTPAPCCYDTGMYVLLALDPADETAGDAEEDDDLGEVSARPWSPKSAELSEEHRRSSAASVSEVP